MRTSPTEKRRLQGCHMLPLLTPVNLVLRPCSHHRFPHPRCSAGHLLAHSIHRPRRRSLMLLCCAREGRAPPPLLHAICLFTPPLWVLPLVVLLPPFLRLPTPPPISPPRTPDPAPSSIPSHAQDFSFPPLPPAAPASCMHTAEKHSTSAVQQASPPSQHTANDTLAATLPPALLSACPSPVDCSGFQGMFAAQRL